VPRRNLIPFVLLAVLALLTLLFAVLGASSAPSGATLTVQNGSGRTFGSPTGSTSLAMELVIGAGTGAGAGTTNQVRLINYVPPDRMAVYQVGTKLRLLGLLNQAEITCALSAYAAIVGGSTPWSGTGNAYTRTESLASYSARVPTVTTGSCAPRPATVHGQVHENAAVRSGYLVGVRVTVVVPPQTLSNGSPAAHGSVVEAVVLLQINGTRVHKLGS